MNSALFLTLRSGCTAGGTALFCLLPLPIEFCRMAHHLPVATQREQPAPCWPRPLSTQASKGMSRAANLELHGCRLFLSTGGPHIPATWRRQYTGPRKPCQAACQINRSILNRFSHLYVLGSVSYVPGTFMPPPPPDARPLIRPGCRRWRRVRRS